MLAKGLGGGRPETMHGMGNPLKSLMRMHRTLPRFARNVGFARTNPDFSAQKLTNPHVFPKKFGFVFP